MTTKTLSQTVVLLFVFFATQFTFPVPGWGAVDAPSVRETIAAMSSFGSRATGSPGYTKAASFIEQQLRDLGLEPQTHEYEIPVREFLGANLTIDGNILPLASFTNNAITPQAIDGTISAPLYYVGSGNLEDLDGKDLRDSIVLLDFDSGRNWQQLASIGAKAAVFLADDDSPGRIFFTEKKELTPLQFPCFWLQRPVAEQIFGQLEIQDLPLNPRVQLEANAFWKNRLAKNIYALIEGTNPERKEDLIILEAFFDTEEFIVGDSPGADAATSIATLLEVAKSLVSHPQEQSILLLATSGRAQALAGMRDFIWSISARSKDLRNQKQQLQKNLKETEANLEILENLVFPLAKDQDRDNLLAKAIRQSLDHSVDEVSRQLIQLRLGTQTTETKNLIKQTANRRLIYRRLGWATGFDQLNEEEDLLFRQLLPKAIARNKAVAEDIERQQQALQSASSLRDTVRDYQIKAIVSLHLSSHGNGVGGFHRGWLYNLKPTINRTAIYSPLAGILAQVAGQPIGRAAYQDTLRPSHLQTWDSWLLDQPNLGGEVSALAGYLGLSLVTTGDSRAMWGTPGDTVEHVDWQYVIDQTEMVARLVSGITGADTLSGGGLPRDGFVTVTARANLLLQGELFANYPAGGTAILAYQGNSMFYAMVSETGSFTVKGVADKKNVLDKLIIEGYRFDEETGETLWAIDKKETGKDNYRLKLLRKSMQTDLVLFNCRETTLFDLLEPRSFAYMTKIQLFDGRRDAPPEHYWFSRIDTRDSIISSIYTEPGTLLKLTLSDTVLTNKMILTNASAEKDLGHGYLVDDHPSIPNTLHHAAEDAWTLLLPRIDNLESHGIYDEKIDDLKNRGLAALQKSSDSLATFTYSTGKEAAAEALALAARVYVQISKTQKDVLFGVLFYIALFVPFAFVMERFIFNFAGIYKRIVGFSAILVLVIAVIYNVHPAFQLAYSPMVIILAFFIISLSFMVTLIIFFRFEDEMILLQRRTSHKRPEEISRWNAFVAAFFLGISNLRRRRLRTILTCTTLVILTFTIMSFTTIKSNRQQVRLAFQPLAPYQGLLLKKVNSQSLPPQATDILVGSMPADSKPAPRVWLEGRDPSRPVIVPLRRDGREIEIKGLIGLSPNEAHVTGLDTILTSGRWFNDEDKLAIILEEGMAARLGIATSSEETITLMGSPYTVIGTFRADALEKALDLDGEPLTPVIFPEEAGREMAEEEFEALESGEDIRSFQSRYRHIPAGQTAIIPAGTLLAAGGKLKNVAIKLDDPDTIGVIAAGLTDRFSLAIFTGEPDGVWLYNISDTLNYSGVPNIIIPLLISVLIVLNTMISSVYERKGEIGVYTSVGLAPSHVGFLFVAEAMALAVISVVIGYLVAQISAALFSATPLWAGITVNYSSLAGVAAMGLVITVVLISVLYPARVAARIAIPDVNRTFRLPQPVDNSILVTLPFLMKFQEHESIGGFVYNYLASHRDISHGLFSTGEVQVVFSCSTVGEIVRMVKESDSPHELKCLHIRTDVWLAPFDFGIMQTVDIQFCPAREGRDFLEIKITLYRQSGESGIWQRINTAFLHEIRRQLLVWRSLDDTTHDHLRKSFQRVVAADDLIREVS
ncbi:MAG: ABC-type antimicrobial peptide transport system, permease component [Desulfobulbaceae bacterium BRH_c16a]|nr:MAG: ABC-type antimicrobial peptide transport system, permease component [Desulfobulbaceae bacterium BRH_c16a]